eukprot:7148782-Pyramimonas_sp.AAC.1
MAIRQDVTLFDQPHDQVVFETTHMQAFGSQDLLQVGHEKCVEKLVPRSSVAPCWARLCAKS